MRQSWAIVREKMLRVALYVETSHTASELRNAATGAVKRLLYRLHNQQPLQQPQLQRCIMLPRGAPVPCRQGISPVIRDVEPTPIAPVLRSAAVDAVEFPSLRDLGSKYLGYLNIKVVY